MAGASVWPGPFQVTVLTGERSPEILRGDVLRCDPKRKPKRGDLVIVRQKDGTRRLLRFGHQYRGVRYLQGWRGPRVPLNDGATVAAVVYELRRQYGGAK